MVCELVIPELFGKGDVVVLSEGSRYTPGGHQINAKGGRILGILGNLGAPGIAHPYYLVTTDKGRNGYSIPDLDPRR